MRTTFVLGAGCSRNYSNPPIIPGLISPLQGDFFEIAARYIEHHDLSKAWDPPRDEYSTLPSSIPTFSTFIYALQDFYLMNEGKDYGTRPIECLRALHRRNVSLEDAMTILESALANERVVRNHRFVPVHLEHLVGLIARVLSGALCNGPCIQHARLAKCLRSNVDGIISFNYDTLIDDALTNEFGFNDARYGIGLSCFQIFEEVTDNNGERDYNGFKQTPPTWDLPSNLLLKMHGSLNFLKCATCQSISLDRGALGVDYMQFLVDWFGDENEQDLSNSIAMSCYRCGGRMKRLLVPPLLTKDYTGSYSAQLLSHASNMLLFSGRIVVIGYSLPITDVASRLLFNSGPNIKFPLPKSWKRQLVLVDPCEATRDRWKGGFWHHSLTENERLEDFLVAEGV